MASTTAPSGNNVPCASRSSEAASLQGWKLSCSGKGKVAATTVVTAAAAMPSCWRLTEQALDGALRPGRGGGNVVIMAAAMLSCRGRQLKTQQERGGGWTARGVFVPTEDDGNYRWDLPRPPAASVMATDTAMPPLSPPTDNGDNYDNKGGK